MYWHSGVASANYCDIMEGRKGEKDITLRFFNELQAVQMMETIANKYQRYYFMLIENVYDFDDIIAQSIIHKLAMGRPIFDENDNQVFYGVVKDKEELESLTIDGNPVDEIIPIETQDGMYYFWTYSKTRIAEKLDIDMGEFRYQEVIDQLEIRYDKQEEE